jgi:hypothetical protein
MDSSENRTESAAWDSSFRPGVFAAVLGLLIVVSFPGIVACLKSFVIRDFAAFGYPLAHYHKASLWDGEIPLWNPLNHCGLPFLAQWNTLTLYPPTLIYLLLPLEWSLSWFCLAHLYAGGLGAYFLARRWTRSDFAAVLAGIGFAFNGLMQNSLMWPNNMAAFGCLPWVILTVETGVAKGGWSVVIAALVGGLQMLTGAPEVILLGWLLIGLLVFGKAIQEWCELRDRWLLALRMGRLAVIVGLIGMVAAAQLLPFLEWLHLSDRMGEMKSGRWAASPYIWANFLLPWFDCVRSPQGLYAHNSQQWSHSFYPGMGMLILLPLALRNVFTIRVTLMTVFGLFCLAMLLGGEGLIYPWLATALSLDEMRYPVKFLLPVALLVPLLAASAVASVKARPGRGEVCWVGIGGGVTLAFSLMALGIAVNSLGQGGDDHFVRNSMTRIGLLVVGIGLAIGWLKARKRTFRAGLAWLMVVFLWLDLRTHSPQMTATVPASLWGQQYSPMDELEPAPRAGVGRTFMLPEVRRYLGYTRLRTPEDGLKASRLTMKANRNLPVGAAKCYGLYSLPPSWANDIMRSTVKDRFTLHDPMADFLGICQAAKMEFGLGVQWQSRHTVMPLVTAGQKPLFGGDEDLLKAMNSDHFDPRKMVLFQAGDETQVIGNTSPDAVVDGFTFSPHKIGFRVTSPEPALAVLAQTHHPNWTATVDGSPTVLLRANFGFQAVNVPGGTSEVRLVYVDGKFRIGCLISVLGLVLAGILWWHGGKTTGSAAIVIDGEAARRDLPKKGL